MHRTLTASLAALALLLLAACAGAGPGAPSPAGPVPVAAVEALQVAGAPGNRINLVLLGDGYRLEDQGKLTQDARSWLATFRNTSPFSNYAEYFNVSLVHLVSREDGAGNGMHGLGVLRDTALGATFENASRAGQAPDYRLLVVDNGRALAAAMANAPECTRVLVLVNDGNYGGSGGTVGVFSSHAESAFIALHELGHSFAGLADEYACGDSSALPGSIEAFPNVTTLQALEQIKWRAWIEPGMPLPTPDPGAHATQLGLFAGAYYHDAGVFRPRQNCRMRSLHEPFCEVCSEAIVRRLYQEVTPLDAAAPAGPIRLEAGASVTLALTRPVPNPDSMRVSWTLDGAALAGTGNCLNLQGAGLAPGGHQVSARLLDATALVRTGQERLTQVHTWNVTAGTAVAAMQAAAPVERHLLVRVLRNAGGFQVLEQRVVELPLPPGPDRPDWLIEAVGADGQVQFQTGIADPALLRGEFQGAADPDRIDALRLGGDRPPVFLVRLPVLEVQRLEIFQRGSERTRLGAAQLSAEP